VGAGVLCFVGTAVGVRVGAAVGAGVGVAVGAVVGSPVGAAVGIAVGAAVGFSVGASVTTGLSVTSGASVYTGAALASGPSVNAGSSVLTGAPLPSGSPVGAITELSGVLSGFAGVSFTPQAAAVNSIAAMRTNAPGFLRSNSLCNLANMFFMSLLRFSRCPAGDTGVFCCFWPQFRFILYYFCGIINMVMFQGSTPKIVMTMLDSSIATDNACENR
jgi:hypothetical protein